MSLLGARPEWWDDALCRGQDANLWFPERGKPTEPAKRICAACPVKTPCLEFSLEWYIKLGVWGGRSERERRRMRKTRHIARRAGAIIPAFTPLAEPPAPTVRRRRGRCDCGRCAALREMSVA